MNLLAVSVGLVIVLVIVAVVVLGLGRMAWGIVRGDRELESGGLDGSPDDRLDRRRLSRRAGPCSGVATRAERAWQPPRQYPPMELSAHDSLILLGVLGAAAFLLGLAQVTRIPYPILLVLGGLGVALVPGMPTITLDPELVFVAFLPPLLYGTAYFTSLRELRANIGAISLLAVGLVLVTTVVVAWVAHAVIPGLDWPTAFVLGAIVSPTDPTAATAISERVGLPRHLVGLIDGESLLNDATALVAYRVAVITVAQRELLAGLRLRPLLRRRRGRDHHRPRSRLAGTPGAPPARRPAARAHHLAAHGLRRLPAGAGARRLRRARSGHGRHLHGLAHARADQLADPYPGAGALGDRLLRPQRRALHARRPAAAGDRRRALRASRAPSWSAGRCSSPSR